MALAFLRFNRSPSSRERLPRSNENSPVRQRVASPPPPKTTSNLGRRHTIGGGVSRRAVASSSSSSIPVVCEEDDKTKSKSKKRASWRRSLVLQFSPPPSSSSGTVASIPESEESFVHVEEEPPTPPPKPRATVPAAPFTPPTPSRIPLPLDSDLHEEEPYERPQSRCSSRRSSLRHSPPPTESPAKVHLSLSKSLTRNSSTPSGSPSSKILPLALTEDEMDRHIVYAADTTIGTNGEIVVKERNESMNSKREEEPECDETEEGETEDEELARLREYARGVRDFMGMFRMHAAELFDEEQYEEQIQEDSEVPRREVDEFEDAESTEEENQNYVSAPRGGLRRVSGVAQAAEKSEWDEGDSYDEGFEFEYGEVADGENEWEDSPFTTYTALSALSNLQQRPKPCVAPLSWRFSELEVIDEEEDEDEAEAEAEVDDSQALQSELGSAAELEGERDDNGGESAKEESFSYAATIAESVKKDGKEEGQCTIPFPALEKPSIPTMWMASAIESAPSHFLVQSKSQSSPAPVTTPSRPVLTLTMPTSASPVLSVATASKNSIQDKNLHENPNPSPSPNSSSALLTPASTLIRVMMLPRRPMMQSQTQASKHIPNFSPSWQSQSPPETGLDYREKASLSPFGNVAPVRNEYDGMVRELAFVVHEPSDPVQDVGMSPDEEVMGSLEETLEHLRMEKAKLEDMLRQHFIHHSSSSSRTEAPVVLSLRAQIDGLSRALRQLELASPISPIPGAPVVGSVPLPMSSPISPSAPDVPVLLHLPLSPAPSTPTKSSRSKSPSPRESPSKLSSSKGTPALQRSPSKGRRSVLSNLDLPPLSPLISLARESPAPAWSQQETEGIPIKRGLLFHDPNSPASPRDPASSLSLTATPSPQKIEAEEASPPLPVFVKKQEELDESESTSTASCYSEADTGSVSEAESKTTIEKVETGDEEAKEEDGESKDPFIRAVARSRLSPRLTNAFLASVYESADTSVSSTLSTASSDLVGPLLSAGSSAELLLGLDRDVDDDAEDEAVDEVDWDEETTIVPFGRHQQPVLQEELPGRAQIKRRGGSMDLKAVIAA